MEIVGHSQLAMTTDLYFHVMPTALRAAADAMDRVLFSRTELRCCLSSSGTRLTNEFRYLLDMIILGCVVGRFRAAAIYAGLRGRGQGSAGRTTAQQCRGVRRRECRSRTRGVAACRQRVGAGTCAGEEAEAGPFRELSEHIAGFDTEMLR